MIVARPAKADKVVQAVRYGLISGAPHLPGFPVMHVGCVQSAPLAFAVVAFPGLLFGCLPVHTACSPGVREPVQVHPRLLRAEKAAADLDP